MMRQVLHCFIVLSLFSALPAANAGAAEKASDEFIKMIVKLLGNPDREFRAAGLEQVRSSAKGTAATQAFAAQLPNLEASNQIALLNALADRGDVAARPAVLALMSYSKDEQVRTTAIASLGRLGEDADVSLLIKILLEGPEPEKAAARRGLVLLGGNAVSKLIAAESAKPSPPGLRAALIEILATRRAGEEVPVLVPATLDDNAQVRSAAMSALGQLGRPEQIAPMLQGVLKAQKGGERDNAEKSVVMVCTRIDNEEQRGAKLIEELLPLVGRVGGKMLIGYVGDIAGEADPVRRKLGIDALSKWPDATVADKLLEIANKATDPAERNQAFQGYVKIAASRDNRSDKQRYERMKEAMKNARTPEEQTLVINRIRTAYDVDAVRFVLPYLDQPPFAQIACETIVEIAHHREVRDPHKAEFDKILDKVIEVTKDPVVVDRAQRYKKGQTWERPKK